MHHSYITIILYIFKKIDENCAFAIDLLQGKRQPDMKRILVYRVKHIQVCDCIKHIIGIDNEFDTTRGAYY